MFAKRSTKKELLDADQIPTADLYQNLKELHTINRFLGGHAVTLAGLEQFELKKDRRYTIVDIGSGGGDTLKAMANWGRKHQLHLNLIGVDLKWDCVQYASEYCKAYPEIKCIQSDYRNLQQLGIEPDIVVASLFCHHLNDVELQLLFTEMQVIPKLGFVMNDLHRHPLAYYSIAVLTFLFSTSYLVKNDAKLSVLRSFRKHELFQIVTQSGGKMFSLNWVWAFRWLLVMVKS
jgi:2-polyprenyl-3-methyl-5-hydroxy-6-metoxy-1,4-benzoquinol methylase